MGSPPSKAVARAALTGLRALGFILSLIGGMLLLVGGMLYGMFCIVFGDILCVGMIGTIGGGFLVFGGLMFGIGLLIVIPTRRAWKAEQAKRLEEIQAQRALIAAKGGGARLSLRVEVDGRGGPEGPVASKCPECGAPVDRGARECEFCGTPFV